MKTAIIDRKIWNEWKSSTWFIVDFYHYTNHHATDEICCTWCNPAPQDGSAPNLVVERIDKNGNTVKVREFNTEACEQLNAWLSGYESILKHMTVENFNWFLHVMLFYHVEHVLAKMKTLSVQKTMADKKNTSNEDTTIHEKTTANKKTTADEKTTVSEDSDEEDSDSDESSSESDMLQVLSSNEDKSSSDEDEDKDKDSGHIGSGTNKSEESDSSENESDENDSAESESSESRDSNIHMHLSD